MDYFVYLKAPEHLAQFIKHTFGDPVELIRESPESRILREHTIKTPADAIDDSADCNVKIRIPHFKEKDPRIYNYISNATKLALIESFDEILKRSMWQEIGCLGVTNCKLSTLLYSYMERHGIEEKYWYTISQRWYRYRRAYHKQVGVSI